MSNQNLKRFIKFPEGLSEELAELIGIHLGDGSLYRDNNYNYNITYSGNLKKDKNYMNYINLLFLNLFNIKLKPFINEKKSSIELRLRSKAIYIFFKDTLKLPSGKKKDLSIPNYIKKDKIYLTAFLRGLFDTDGCFILQKSRKYYYIIAKISTKHKNFAQDISDSLMTLSIPSYIATKGSKFYEGYDVIIRNKNAKLFFNIIKPKNQRNISKYYKIVGS